MFASYDTFDQRRLRPGHHGSARVTVLPDESGDNVQNPHVCQVSSGEFGVENVAQQQ